MKKLISFIKTERKRHGMTQEDLSMRSGVALSTIRAIEQGKNTVKLETVNRILLLFNYELGPTPLKDE